MVDRFKPYPELCKQVEGLSALVESIQRPFTLAVFGRMKTGKSSLINALVGRPLAITGVEEATATINWISYGDSNQADTVLVHRQDGRVEPIPLSRLTDWSGKGEDVLKRVSETAFLQLYAHVEQLRKIQIVDTPGTGSVADEHEDIAQKFLTPRAAEDTEEEGRKADALMYVFSPVGRERDEEALNEFRNSRMPGSDPYNSIGVLHKWDGLESDDLIADAQKKAERLKHILSDVVCDVIPVSAPLAMVSRHAPDSFFEQMLELTASPGASDELLRALRRDNRWDADPSRNQARMNYELPWVSFKRVVNILLEHEINDVEEARRQCLNYSGVLKLESALDRRFFKRAAIIKQRLARVKATESVQSGLVYFNRHLRDAETDCENFALLENEVSEPTVKSWLNKKNTLAQESLHTLEKWAVETDQTWLEEKGRMDLLEKDFTFLETLDNDPGFVDPCDSESIRALLNEDNNRQADLIDSMVVLETMLERYAPKVNVPDRNQRILYEHLVLRISERMNELS